MEHQFRSKSKKTIKKIMKILNKATKVISTDYFVYLKN